MKENGDFIFKIAKGIVPEGIDVLIPWHHPVKIKGYYGDNDNDHNNDNDHDWLMMYQIVYCGSFRPLTRANANDYREKLEAAIEGEQGLSLRGNRRGRLVSKSFPHSLLTSILNSKMTK
mmetsp:Transcript_5353/g.7754  ORF Transcript_5353/g.7754 Transcript_5353/m.7754 type:complete len:119 (+) Transcript_5353:338-694(+)